MRIWAGLAAIVVLLSGCSLERGGSGGPGATAPLDVESDLTIPGLLESPGPPVWEQPAHADVGFTQAVLAQIDGGFTTAVQHLATTRTLDEQFMAYLDALNTTRWVELAVWEWQELKDELVDRPGRGTTTVQRIVTWSPGCIVAAVRGDYTAWFPPLQEDPRQRYVALVAGRDPGDQPDLNPTGWQLNYDAWQEDGGEPEDTCW
jgi:hypothetical protein